MHRRSAASEGTWPKATAKRRASGCAAREAVFAVAKDGLSGNEALDAAVGRLKSAGIAAGRDAATTLLRTLVQLVYAVVRVAE